MIMRKDYDLKTLKVKRRGALPGFENKEGSDKKVRITIALDQAIVDHFKSSADGPCALPYQTQINQALRQFIMNLDTSNANHLSKVKSQLLQDPAFLEKLAYKLEQADIRR